ncbi:BON domain-containing protein [Limnothrix sp. FACHB-881]|uniref:OmpA family protein n=1 Tax=Limnothrix sp. FACHB-881 TaxID=2692819 RepID=UPI00168233F3|nr:BON domain-containing protein [Limnothrix sp. FACHB-881]MBD2634293.1 BON domain-containing protein [Limnothrix sp. FACHB-881]
MPDRNHSESEPVEDWLDLLSQLGRSSQSPTERPPSSIAPQPQGSVASRLAVPDETLQGRAGSDLTGSRSTLVEADLAADLTADLAENLAGNLAENPADRDELPINPFGADPDLLTPPSPATGRSGQDTTTKAGNGANGNGAPSEGNGSSGEDAWEQLQSLLIGDNFVRVEDRVEALRGKMQRVQQQVDAIESLLQNADQLVAHLSPLIARLIERRVLDAREEICQALLPTIDRLIYERSLQDRQAMAEAIAPVLDAAIVQRMQDAPADLALAIAHAIAPETASAMREQYQLDADSMIQALGPMMGASIKEQIALERDAMVDALYPVIGNTIAKYMKDAIDSINEKVHNTLSMEGVGRKMRAKMQGVSEAELILREAMPYRVQAAFLIHKASGLVMSECQSTDQDPLEGDMLAGMLTAIRSFVNDCMVQDGNVSELHEIQYNDSQIAMEVAGYCYLAVIVKGQPSKGFYRQLRSTLERLVERYDRPLQSFDGDSRTLPAPVHTAVTGLVRPIQRRSYLNLNRRGGFPWALTGLILVLSAAIAAPWIWWNYQNQRNRGLLAAVQGALNTSPQLAVYNLSVDLQGDQLRLRGKVPYPWLRFQAERTATDTYRAIDPKRFQQATPPKNQIIAVQLPTDPILAAAEVQRIAKTLNRDGNVVNASYSIDAQSGGTVTVTGSARSRAEASAIAAAFERVPGTNRVVNSLQIVIPSLTVRLYFELGADRFVDVDIAGKIDPIRQFLQSYPDLNLRVVGHSAPTEPNASALALQRAQLVRSALISRGISAQRLVPSAQVGPPPDVTQGDGEWMSRCVRFEAIPAP